MKIYTEQSTKKDVCNIVGKNTLRFIRETMGIDFEKPVIINYGLGTFTIKNVWDIIPHKTYDYRVCVLIKGRKQYFRDTYYIVELYENNFDIELKSKTYFNWKTIPDTFCRKGDFNEYRKDCQYFIIAQNEEYTINRKNKSVYHSNIETVEQNKRYIIKGINYSHTKENEKYISSIELKDTENNGKTFNWQLYGNGNIFYVPKHYFTLDELFDNSGYFVHARREELKRQAAKIKSERDKAKYLETNNTNKIIELKEAAKKANEHLAQILKNTFDYENMYLLHNKLYNFAWIYRDIHLFEERTTKKEYSSIEKSDKAYIDIMDKIAKITEGIQ